MEELQTGETKGDRKKTIGTTCAQFEKPLRAVNMGRYPWQTAEIANLTRNRRFLKKDGRRLCRRLRIDRVGNAGAMAQGRTGTTVQTLRDSRCFGRSNAGRL